MSNKLILAAAVFVTLVSCNDDIVEGISNDVKIDKIFNVSCNKNDTRAAIFNIDQSKNVNLTWETEPKDHVTVFAKGHENVEGDDFVLSGTTSFINDASFKGKTWKADSYYFLHPYQSDAVYYQPAGGSKPYIKYTIPTSQNAVNGTFDRNALIMLGEDARNGTVALNHACAFFYINVGEGVCNKITFKGKTRTDGKGDQYLSGTVISEVGSSTTAIKEFPNASNTVTLNGINGKAGVYYVAFIPVGETNPGIEIYFDDQKTPIKKIKEGQTFNAGYFYNLGTYNKQ